MVFIIVAADIVITFKRGFHNFELGGRLRARYDLHYDIRSNMRRDRANGDDRTQQDRHLGIPHRKDNIVYCAGDRDRILVDHILEHLGKRWIQYSGSADFDDNCRVYLRRGTKDRH